MYAKLLMCTVLIAFIVVQLVGAKGADKCYSCNSPSSCRAPKVQNCDQKAANTTRSELAKYFSHFTNVTNNEFECLLTNYTFLNYSGSIVISGCINSNLEACYLVPNNILINTGFCIKCKKNLCNSSENISFKISAVLSSILGLLIMKYWYY